MFDTAPRLLCIHMHGLCHWSFWRGTKSLLVTNTAVQNYGELANLRRAQSITCKFLSPRTDTDSPLVLSASCCFFPLDVSPVCAGFFGPIQSHSHFLLRPIHTYSWVLLNSEDPKPFAGGKMLKIPWSSNVSWFQPSLITYC